MKIEGILKEQLLCKSSDYMLCYLKGELIIRSSLDMHVIQKCRIHSILKSSNLIERLFRYKPRTAISIDNNHFLFSDHGKIQRYSISENKIITEHFFSKGMSNPLSFCTRYDDKGKLIVLYGEYIQNPKREAVSIYRRNYEKWDIIYEFPRNSVKHIHNIFHDKYRNRYLILTGDENSESGIWEADYNFSYVKEIIKGKQQFRACVLFPTEKAIYFATDTPIEQNWLYKLSGHSIIEPICKISGPCIFGIVKQEELFISTSVEGNTLQNRIIYLISNKLGKGVKDYFSHVYRINKNGEVVELIKMKKDIWPLVLFEFGNIKFPNSNDDKIYVCPQSLKAKYGTYILSE